MRALLIIDMQNESFQPAYPAYDSEAVVKKINTLSAQFRQKRYPVLFIQHDGSKEGCYIPSTEGWELLPSLNTAPGDVIISKTANDSFYRTVLKEELARLGADELVITGTATDFCVDSTVKSALINDFNVTVIADAHTTTDRPGLKAKQVIDHYNWLWKETTPTHHGRIAVIGFDDFMKK